MNEPSSIQTAEADETDRCAHDQSVAGEPANGEQPAPVDRGAGPVGPGVADGVFRQLDPNFIRAERVGWWIAEAVLGAPIIIFLILCWVFRWLDAWVLIPSTVAGVLLILLLRFLAMRLPPWVFNTTSYSVSPLGMVIRRGIFWKREEHIPRSRVQHTDVTQGPLQRQFRLGTLILHTAGTHNASVQLSGLNYEHASRIRDYLIVSGQDDAV